MTDADAGLGRVICRRISRVCFQRGLPGRTNVCRLQLFHAWSRETRGDWGCLRGPVRQWRYTQQMTIPCSSPSTPNLTFIYLTVPEITFISQIVLKITFIYLTVPDFTFIYLTVLDFTFIDLSVRYFTFNNFYLRHFTYSICSFP